jgi:hypothetical protein
MFGDTLGDAVGKVRAVNDDECVGLLDNGEVGRLAHTTQNERQARNDFAWSHDRGVGHGKNGGETVADHVGAADTGDANLAIGFAEQCFHQLATQRVAGWLARDQHDMGDAAYDFTHG